MNELFKVLGELNAWLILLFGGGISAVIKLLINQMKLKNDIRKQEKEMTNERFKLLERASVAMLHNKIYKQCSEHLDAGFISVDDLDDMEYLFKAYKGLGGNGTGETLYNKVKGLPNKEVAKDEIN